MERMKPPPRRMAAHFPETRWDHLDPHLHGDALMERILEYGSREEVGWLLETYGLEPVREFLRRKGVRRLSKRSLNFWCLVWGVDDVEPHPWASTVDVVWGR